MTGVDREQARALVEAWGFRSDHLGRAAGVIASLLAELEQAKAERDENEGAFRVWRRRAETAENALADLWQFTTSAEVPVELQERVLAVLSAVFPAATGKSDE